jgi:hypothetical protein
LDTGFVEELPGANTQGATLEEARTGGSGWWRELLGEGASHSIFVIRAARKTSAVPRHAGN